jgi:hypothetical protein
MSESSAVAKCALSLEDTARAPGDGDVGDEGLDVEAAGVV